MRQRPVQPDKSGITGKDISDLVTAFYAAVRRHPRLGPVFEARIGTTDPEWAPHLKKIEAFWANVMLGSRSYQGNPMQAHAKIAGIVATDFDQWLQVFDETAFEILPARKAQAFSILAHRIGRSLAMGLLVVEIPRSTISG